MTTAAQIRRLLDYCPETGLLRWKERPASEFATPTACKAWNTRFAGAVAGSPNKYGYIRLAIKGHGEPYAHRLAWLLMTGEWPVADVDHRDRVKTNNRWVNLRAASRSENQANSVARSHNKCGVKGVRRDRTKRKWVAQIIKDKKYHHLWTFLELSEAAAAYEQAAREMHGEFACVLPRGERNHENQVSK